MDESFGTIPVRKKTKWQVFIVRHRKGRHFGFPKGHKEPNEDNLACAYRELKEETNLCVNKLLSEEVFSEEYTYVFKGEKINKRVLYYLVLAGGTIRLQEKELLDGNWVDLDKAGDILTYPNAKKILREVKKKLKEIYDCDT